MSFPFKTLIYAKKEVQAQYRDNLDSWIEGNLWYTNLNEFSIDACKAEKILLCVDVDDVNDLQEIEQVLDAVAIENPAAIIIVFSSENSLGNACVLAAKGANFLIRKPLLQKEIEFAILSSENICVKILQEQGLTKNIQALTNKLESWGYLDVLTQCYNHRYFSRRLTEEFNRGDRAFKCLSEVVFDIDSFSSINDVYGPEIGDIVISQFADVIKDSVRSHDILCRTGAQEFSILLSETTSDGAEIFAERIIEVVENTHFGTDKEHFKISVSAGVSTCPTENVRTASDLVRTAKMALKDAKKHDGSMLVVFDKGAKIKKPIVDADELRHKISDLSYQLSQGMLEMVYGFARIIEAKDEYTGQHVESTQTLAEKLAIQLELPEDQIENIRHAAILHDLGKVGIDDRILRKEGKLTDDEFDEIKKHPVIAAEILQSIHGLHESLPAILHHHERYDGTGYPDHLKGDDIPLEARIISISDVYQALTSDRPYRKAFSKDKALGIITEQSGKQFDPAIVQAFLEVMK